MLGVFLSHGFIGVLALILFLTFAASGITWLVATVLPGSAVDGRRAVGLVAGVTGIVLVAVLVIGEVLAPQGAGPGPQFRETRGAGQGQQVPSVPQQRQQVPSAPQQGRP